jgi:hypothetical protein
MDRALACKVLGAAINSEDSKSPNFVAGYVCAVAGAAISLSVIVGWQSWSNGFASTIPMPSQRWGRWGYAAGIVGLWALIPCALFFVFGYGLSAVSGVRRT